MLRTLYKFISLYNNEFNEVILYIFPLNLVPAHADL